MCFSTKIYKTSAKIVPWKKTSARRVGSIVTCQLLTALKRFLEVFTAFILDVWFLFFIFFIQFTSRIEIKEQKKLNKWPKISTEHGAKTPGSRWEMWPSECGKVYECLVPPQVYHSQISLAVSGSPDKKSGLIAPDGGRPAAASKLGSPELHV